MNERSKRTAGKPRVIVVGGGYVGWEVARDLDAYADVTLIEQREAFVHVSAMIRALVQPALLDQAIIPYDSLLSAGRVLRARVASVEADGVTLEDGRRIPGHYIVVATGSSYAAPFKPQGSSVEALRNSMRETLERVRAAHTIAIVGAGAVGTELAGEMVNVFPDKKIRLISSEPRLFPMYPEKLGSQLHRKLSASGVDVILNQRVSNLASTSEPYAGQLSLADGRVIEADLIFPVIGAKGDSTLLISLPGSRVGTLGRVMTDPWMRPSVYANVFAAGDVAEMGDGMTIVATTRQIPWLVKALKALIAGKSIEQVKPYQPWKLAPILLPLGPAIGNSFLPFGVVGDFVTSLFKGKKLFIPKYRKAFRVRAS